MTDNTQIPSPEEASSLATRQPAKLLTFTALTPMTSMDVNKQRIVEFQKFIADCMIENEDYGVIPGTKKPSLLKPGADKLCELYALSDDYVIVSKEENWEVVPPRFDYTFKCILTSIRHGLVVATGVGSCSSWESKYKYRQSGRKCPKCEQEGTIIKGKKEFDKTGGEGGWLCFAKKGGCGATFVDNDEQITKQETKRVFNEDIADQKNTVLKIAKKRAKVDAVLAATRSSGIFTQDVEDISSFQDESNAVPASAASAPAQPRQELLVCPKCKKKAVIHSKAEYGGGWYCLPAKGGCSAKFAENDPDITKQTGAAAQSDNKAGKAATGKAAKGKKEDPNKPAAANIPPLPTSAPPESDRSKRAKALADKVGCSHTQVVNTIAKICKFDDLEKFTVAMKDPEKKAKLESRVDTVLVFFDTVLGADWGGKENLGKAIRKESLPKSFAEKFKAMKDKTFGDANA
jgi:hypothetical protein